MYFSPTVLTVRKCGSFLPALYIEVMVVVDAAANNTWAYKRSQTMLRIASLCASKWCCVQCTLTDTPHCLAVGLQQQAHLHTYKAGFKKVPFFSV